MSSFYLYSEYTNLILDLNFRDVRSYHSMKYPTDLVLTDYKQVYSNGYHDVILAKMDDGKVVGVIKLLLTGFPSYDDGRMNIWNYVASTVAARDKQTLAEAITLVDAAIDENKANQSTWINFGEKHEPIVYKKQSFLERLFNV